MSKKLSAVLLAVLLVLSSVYLYFWTTQKQGLHCDEVYSYGLSNYEGGVAYKTTDENENPKWNSKEDIYSYLVASKDHRFEYGQVIENQKNDVHPPFHYLILHTVASFFPGSYSYLIGIIPNILFTLGTGIILYLIGVMVLKNRIRALILALAFLFSVNAVNMAIYIRMYSELAFFSVCSLYFHIKLIKNDFSLNKRDYILLAVSVVLGAYTHYYFLILQAAEAIILLIFALFKKSFKKILPYIITMAISAVVYFIIWPTCFSHIFASGRGEEAFNNVTTSSLGWTLSRYRDIIKQNVGNAFYNIGLWALILSIIYYCYDKSFKNKSYALNTDAMINVFLALSGGIYLLLVSKVAPYQTDRYISPVFPVVYILALSGMFNILELVTAKISKYGEAVRCIIVSLIVAFSFVTTTNASLVTNVSEVEPKNYLYRVPLENVVHFEENKENKCIVIYDHEAQFLFNLPDYMDNYKSVMFVHKDELASLDLTEDLKDEKEVVVYVNHSLPCDDLMVSLKEKSGFENYEWQFYSGPRHWAHIYKMIR